MKCLLCPAEIDETKAVHYQHVDEQRAYAKELEGWSQVTVHARNGGLVELLVGMVCPAEQLGPGSVKLVKAGPAPSSKKGS